MDMIILFNKVASVVALIMAALALVAMVLGAYWHIMTFAGAVILWVFLARDKNDDNHGEV